MDPTLSCPMSILPLRLPATSSDINEMFGCFAPRVKRGLFVLELESRIRVTSTASGLLYDCEDGDSGPVSMEIKDAIEPRFATATRGLGLGLRELVVFFALRGFASASVATVQALAEESAE